MNWINWTNWANLNETGNNGYWFMHDLQTTNQLKISPHRCNAILEIENQAQKGLTLSIIPSLALTNNTLVGGEGILFTLICQKIELNLSDPLLALVGLKSRIEPMTASQHRCSTNQAMSRKSRRKEKLGVKVFKKSINKKASQEDVYHPLVDRGEGYVSRILCSSRVVCVQSVCPGWCPAWCVSREVSETCQNYKDDCRLDVLPIPYS